jgi:hypothetical protein
MKQQFISLLAIFILINSFSCTKEKIFQNEGIVGKWQLTEVYDGYANGGSFSWNKVSEEYSHSLKFSASGEYSRIENSGNGGQECSGTYVLDAANNLDIKTNCQTLTEVMKISELTNSNLIIDRQGIEGIIRYKYKAVKD